MAMKKRVIGSEQRRALRVLVRCSDGHTEVIVMAHGFAISILAARRREYGASSERYLSDPR
jgi:hypothetical protein